MEVNTKSSISLQQWYVPIVEYTQNEEGISDEALLIR